MGVTVALVSGHPHFPLWVLKSEKVSEMLVKVCLVRGFHYIHKNNRAKMAEQDGVNLESY